MKTLFDPAVRDGLLARLEHVTADSRPRWGRMNVEQMLTHLVEAMRMANGEFPTRPKKMVTRLPVLRELFVYWLPWPKGAPGPRELFPASSRAVDESKVELVRLVNLLGERGAQKEWPDHPVFGKLSSRGWARLGWRHMDHHLRQFGA